MRPLTRCPKGYTRDADKAVSPAATAARVRAALAPWGAGVLAETRRIDTGRLGIPVYLSVCGEKARQVMPTRKQMGKGATPEQAETSALMELVERYSYFNFWAGEPGFRTMTWSRAAKEFGPRLIPVARMMRSVNEELSESQAASVLDLVQWRFCLARDVLTGEDVAVPLDWFKKLNEFNGASAGNSLEESILQGACELVERHVCALVDRGGIVTPTIDQDSVADPVLAGLCRAFAANGVQLWLKDFSLGLPAPTVGALAYDPATFPAASEIVFTAGTASSPVKAAIRAVTEIAQLAGDFQTRSNYEASGLRKFTDPGQIAFVTGGETVSLASLPSFERGDIFEELSLLAQGLSDQDFRLYSVETTHPEIGIAANYNFAPGFEFRERTPHASLGLFVGRILAEEAPLDQARRGLATLARVYPGAHFLPFFQGLLSLRQEDYAAAREHFLAAEPGQPDAEHRSLSAFYAGFALTREEKWSEAAAHLDRAIACSGEVKEYFNLRGVSFFKRKDYRSAAADFTRAVALDKGSAMDLANLGLCHKFLGEFGPAAHFLTAALELDPSLDFARRHLEEALRAGETG
ncbi:MAG: YcaO-like family protein [Desulfovibrionaceae bacterium]|nr:YcaO-like family protein [Desulfovibrionaceae bacterium]